MCHACHKNNYEQNYPCFKRKNYKINVRYTTQCKISNFTILIKKQCSLIKLNYYK